MTLDELVKLVNPIAIVVSGVLNVYLFFKSKTDERFAEIDQCMAEGDQAQHLETADRKAADYELDRRLVALETQLKSVPTHEDLEEIRAALATVGAELAAVNERSRGTLDTVRRIEEHLLDRAR